MRVGHSVPGATVPRWLGWRIKNTVPCHMHKSKECRALYNLVCDGELDDEMNNLRGLARQEVGAMERNIFDSVNAGKAVTDSVTTNNT